MWHIIVLLAFALTVNTVTLTTGCIKRRSKESGEHDGHYCVCNATYCDKSPYVSKPWNSAQYILITSSKSGQRFHVSHDLYRNIDPDNVTAPHGKITINRTKVYQYILGFGGAVTDAAGFNINSLSKKAADKLLRSYFGSRGIGYTIIRTPMGGSDFSFRPYAYAMEENDLSLQSFSLQLEDCAYKIPVIKRAMKLSRYKIKLLTTPWSANPWMKTNNDWTNSGSLRPEYRQLWANYFLKYFEAYREFGLEFWGLTPQNEPGSYRYHEVPFNAMTWSAEEERNFIMEYLYPTLNEAGFQNIKIFIADENRLVLPDWPKIVFQDNGAREIISGIAVHWYFDNIIRVNVLDVVKKLFPEKWLIYTESCIGFNSKPAVILGSWGRGESYAKNIIENMSHWVSSWIDWNIALDPKGGPNWVKNNVDAAVIVNATANEFYKQPMFYAIGHFSKYIPPYSVRIGTTSEKNEGIIHIAFYTPDKATVIVILNLSEESKKISIKDPKKGIATINVPEKSINTMKYW